MTDAKLNLAVTPAQIRMAAMNLLSLREHSAKELQAKLSKKFSLPEVVANVIQKLQHDNLQSDDRFAEAFVNMRLRQGKGALVIRMELKEKGVSSNLVDKHIAGNQDDVNWNQLALKAYEKKYGKAPIDNLKEKARRMRFLTARGFSSANIQYVFKRTNYGLEGDEDNF